MKTNRTLEDAYKVDWTPGMWTDEQDKKAYQRGYRAGLRHLGRLMKREMDEWHKHEQSGLEHRIGGMCTNIACAIKRKHMKSCPLYGQPYIK